MSGAETRQQLQADKRQWRAHLALSPATGGFAVGLAGSFTVEPLVPFVGAELLERHLNAPAIAVAPYNQLIQTCLDPDAAFGRKDLTAIALFWRIEDLFPGLLSAFQRGRESALDEALDEVDQLVTAIGHLRGHFSGAVLVSSPPYPFDPETNIRELTNLSRGGLFHRRVLDHWYQRIAGLDQVGAIDLDGLQRFYGMEAAHDLRKWYLYKQPYDEAFVRHLGRDTGRLLAASHGIPAKKCVVLDCDNTLWGGVIGEDGLDGIALGDEFPGSAFRDFQRQLSALQQSGIMLALASKNNEADVWAVFDGHDGMVLKRDQISSARINWTDKPTNIQEIAAELNIGTDSLVFLDDSSFEIEHVRQACPDVTCVQIPEGAEMIPSLLHTLHLFDRLEVTAEDLKRTDMMRVERERDGLKQTLSADDFLNSLGMEIHFFEAQREHLGRIAQLINKTNQFNLSTIRRSKEEVERLAESADHHLFAVRVNDRFGDYGLVGVALVTVQSNDWQIDTFLLSCRALGRKVETAFLAGIVERAQAAGATTISARFIPTAKNTPATEFLPGHGFTAVDDEKWSASPGDITAHPAHISRV
jgi:FkbH-like protein